MAVELNPGEPSGVQPQPTPYTIRMSDVEAGGVKLTRVEIATVTGSTVIFADAAWMDRLAQAFAKKASEMRQAAGPRIQTATSLEGLEPPFRGNRPGGI